MGTAGRNGVFWWGMASAVGMLLGAFTPWVTALGLSFNGTDFPHGDGWVLVALAVLGGLCVLGSRDRRGLSVVTLVAGLAAAAVTLYDREHLAAAIANSGELGQALVHVGWGIDLAVLASVSLLFQGVVSTLRPEDAISPVTSPSTWTAPHESNPVALAPTPVPTVVTYAAASSGDSTLTVQVWQVLLIAVLLLMAIGVGVLLLIRQGTNHAQPPATAATSSATTQQLLAQMERQDLNATAQSNVRSAIPAAETYYQDLGRNSYAGMTSRKLQIEAPGVSPHLHVAVLNHGNAYCLDDREPSGDRFYYIGGDVSSVPGHAVATIESGSCPS